MRDSEKRLQSAHRAASPRLAAWGVCALLAGCGAPSWAGGIHAQLARSERAVRVVEVPEGGPAARAGLRPEDLVIAIDARPVAGLSALEVHELLLGEVGSTVELEIERDGSRQTLRVERAGPLTYDYAKLYAPERRAALKAELARKQRSGAELQCAKAQPQA